MKRILVTTDFCNGAKKLIKEHNAKDLHELRTVLILLANGKPMPKKYKDHQLTNNEFRELHISGDTLLLYRNETDSNTLIVSLKLANITDHKSLNRDSRRKDYNYEEVSTQDLHDITSADQIDLSDFDSETLYDFVESLADYASMNLQNGYVELVDYYFIDSDLHCEYNYISYESNATADSIDFIIPLTIYDIYDLDSHMDDFSHLVSSAFE